MSACICINMNNRDNSIACFDLKIKNLLVHNFIVNIKNIIVTNNPAVSNSRTNEISR